MLQKPFVRLVLRTAIAQGWTVDSVYDGEETTKVSGLSVTEVVNIADATDDAAIRLSNATTGQKGSLLIMWQGPVSTYPAGEEAIYDYSLTLESVMDAAYDHVM